MREDELKQYRKTVKRLIRYIPRNFIENFCKKEGTVKNLSIRGRTNLLIKCFPKGLSPNQELELLKLSDAFSFSYLSKKWVDYNIILDKSEILSKEDLKNLLLPEWRKEFDKHNYKADLHLGRSEEEHQIGLIFYFMQTPRSYEDYNEGFNFYNPKGRTFVLIDTKNKKFKLSGNLKQSDKIIFLISKILNCLIAKLNVSQKEFDEELKKGDVTKLVFETDPNQGTLRGIQRITLEGPAVEKGLKDLYRVLGDEFEKRIEKTSLVSSRCSLSSSGERRQRGIEPKRLPKVTQLTEYLKTNEKI